MSKDTFKGDSGPREVILSKLELTLPLVFLGTGDQFFVRH
jgi:hypothetical protein